MRTATFLALAMFSAAGTAAAATADDPSPSERVWRLFPSEVEPYRPTTVPLHLLDRDFAERGDWDNNTAPGTSYGSPGDYRGSGVAISLPDGPLNIREVLQGMINDFDRAISSGTEPRASSCICSGVGNYDSVRGGSGTSYK